MSPAFGYSADEVQQPARIRLIHRSLLIGAPFYLYANLFSFPNIPFYLSGDQSFFWTYALRMLHGERIYQDFFEFTPPGTDLFFLALFKLFGPRVWVFNTAVLLLGMALCWICFSIARRLMDRHSALLAAVLFLVLAYGGLLDATHHWFSLLAALCAIRIVIPGRTVPRIAIAGALSGIASFFTLTVGVAGLVALLVVLALEGLRSRRFWPVVLGNQLLLAAAFGVVLSSLTAFFIARVGWKQLWYFQVTYPYRYVLFRHGMFFPGVPKHLTWRGWPEFIQRLFIYALLLGIYPLVLWRCRRRNPAFQNRMQLVLLSLLGLFLLLEIITRVSWTRIYVISAPAFILLVWMATRGGRLPRPIMAGAWCIVVCLALAQTRSRHRLYRQVLQLPAGKAAVSAQQYEKFSSLMQYTKPGDFFFPAAGASVNSALELRNPVYVDFLFTNEASRPEYVERTIRQLESRRVQYILWSPILNYPDDPTHPGADHLGPLRAYLQSHYTRVRVFSDQDEVWRRN